MFMRGSPWKPWVVTVDKCNPSSLIIKNHTGTKTYFTCLGNKTAKRTMKRKIMKRNFYELRAKRGTVFITLVRILEVHFRKYVLHSRQQNYLGQKITVNTSIQKVKNMQDKKLSAPAEWHFEYNNNNYYQCSLETRQVFLKIKKQEMRFV